ncbi:hypothetical protein D918_07267 [Trichuris suis]|nr:hypothetical protein D918_07267 [Trichuris suis]
MRNITDFYYIPKFGDEDVALRDILELRKDDFAYLADLYEKFNAMNLQLQIGSLNLMKTKSVISAFVSKLTLYKRNISRGELCQFPKLAELKRCPHPCDQDIEVYCEHLEMLHEELKRRFHDVLSIVVPHWVIDPFASDEDAELHLQEELVDLQSNDE